MEHARYCCQNYPTIVNNIPKEKNSYDLSMKNFAIIDNQLSASQTDIGESSNLAQVCLTYTYNFDDPKFEQYVCILSVLAQAAIDSAKRRFNVDIPGEIKRIKADINLQEHKYPAFWLSIRKGFNKSNINRKLTCPMNHLYNIKLQSYQPKDETLPISSFFVNHPLTGSDKMAYKVQKMIEQYSLELMKFNIDEDDDDNKDKYLLVRSDFDDLIFDLRGLSMGKKYASIFSWLINRAFVVTAGVKRNNSYINAKIDKNKSMLMKTLYDVNSEVFLSCFTAGE